VAVQSRVRPVLEAPALVIEPKSPGSAPSLVIADLHLGLGASADRPGGPPGGSAQSLAEEVIGLLRAEHADTLVVAGDVKHPIVGTPAPLRPVVFDFFATILSERFSVEVVLGNHDVGLVRHLPREVRVHSAAGVARDGVGIFHGHRWPSNAVLRSPIVLAGHLHPGFRLAPTPEHPAGKRPCWVRVEIPAPSKKPSRRKRKHAVLAAREVIVLPPFNPLAGIEALNRQRPARGRSFLFGRFLSRGVARAYLLDGTDLGVLPMPARPVGRPAAGARSRSAP
jgi:uncharacterized protein